MVSYHVLHYSVSSFTGVYRVSGVPGVCGDSGVSTVSGVLSVFGVPSVPCVSGVPGISGVGLWELCRNNFGNFDRSLQTYCYTGTISE